MSLKISKTPGVAFLLASAVGLGAGCEPTGPMEKAGRGLDRGVQNVKDAVTPAGPAERAGEAVDNALGR